MYKRKIAFDLAKWAEKVNRKPLILRGARQVGKTTVVRNFAKSFDNYIELNLDIEQEKEIFDKKLSLEDLIEGIFFLKRKSDKKGIRTLIFIDEIQNSPVAVKQLRYFYEKRPDLFIIAAGSLLETLIDKTISFPVGRVEYLYMYPFSFEEFLWTFDEPAYNDAFNKIPVPKYAVTVFQKLFSKYVLIGGMPEVVANYRQNNDLNALSSIYNSLITAYLDDVEKYAGNRKETIIIRFLIEKAFYEAGKRIKFTNFGSSNYRADDVKGAFQVLEKAMILNIVYPTSKCVPPVDVNFRKSPKLIFLDTGLVNFFAGFQTEIFKEKEIANVHNGLIAEHIVAQELHAYNKNYLQKIHFWVREKKQSNAEVDFVYPFENMLIPIEVKTGKSGRLRSLHSFMDNCPHNYAVRIYSGEYEIQKTATIAGKEFYLLNLPFFLISKLEKYLALLIRREI